MPSLRGRLFRSMTRAMISLQFDTTAPVEQQRAFLERSTRFLRPPRAITIEPVTINMMPAEWLIPRDVPPDRALLHLHGGGYSMGSCDTHRALVARLAKAAQARALQIAYRLAPEDPFPAALEDALSAVRWLRDQGFAMQNVVFSGDSAGGGLALATMLALRDEGDPLPAAAALISPWTDLASTGDTIQTHAALDPWISPEDNERVAALYVGGHNPCNPLISPLYGDLSGLSPLLIHVGDHEILLSDSTRLAERARAAGVAVDLKVWDGMWHVFHSMMELMPESKRAIQEIGAFVQEHLGTVPVAE